MVATARFKMGIDLRAQGSYTIRLGSDLKPRSSSSNYSSVRYNHKPDIVHDDDTSTCIIPKTKSKKGFELSLKDGDDEYIYDGTRKEQSHTYALVQDKDGKGFVLEQLGSTTIVNLKGAPFEADAAKLAQQYPHLQVEEADEQDGNAYANDADVDGMEDMEPDPDNPFDWRNYMQASDVAALKVSELNRKQKPTPDMAATAQPSSKANTPSTRHARNATSAFAPMQPKAKPKPQASKDKVTAPEAKRAKRSPETERKKEAHIPTVRIDRRASTRHRDDIVIDDSGDLILEDDARETTTRPQGMRSLGLALSGQLGEGPISLRSAVSSPASRVNSPMPSRPSPLGQHDTDNEDIDMDADSPEVAERAAPKRAPAGARKAEEAVSAALDSDQDAEADDDVDDLHLPSPAQVHRHGTGGPTVTADDDDDLEKQMLMAMEEDDDDGSHVQPAASRVESDEESEEE